jgi:putative nucleotidyltransferase with HDIG domain
LIARTRLAEEFLPELTAMELEQDPIHRHKDVLAHTIAVVAKTSPRLKLRLSALLHDVGKPGTRGYGPQGVTFHYHDVVGARMARQRLIALRYPNDVVDDVAKLVELHLRFHTYRMGWTDSAVRRYVRDAGPLLDDLNELTRCDCTTRNAKKAAFLREALRLTGSRGTVQLTDIGDSVDRITGPVDCVTARAVAPLHQLIGFAEPFVRNGAKALFLKGQVVEAELTEATKYWNIKPHLHPSRTGGQGWIVELDQIERRNPSATAQGTRA